MPDKKKIFSRKRALLFGAVSGASLIMPLTSTDAQAQSYICETGGALEASNAITGCAVISYGLTPPEEIELAAPVAPPPAGNVAPGNGGTYAL